MAARDVRRRLVALEQRQNPSNRDAEMSSAARELEAKLLAMPEPDDPIELSEDELQQFIADTKAYLRERRQP